MSAAAEPGRPGGLSVLDAVAVLVGVVIGIGIFGFPPPVAQHASSPAISILLWLAGAPALPPGPLCSDVPGSPYPAQGGESRPSALPRGDPTHLVFAWVT